jgi:hypothetical protein
MKSCVKHFNVVKQASSTHFPDSESENYPFRGVYLYSYIYFFFFFFIYFILTLIKGGLGKRTQKREKRKKGRKRNKKVAKMSSVCSIVESYAQENGT